MGWDYGICRIDAFVVRPIGYTEKGGRMRKRKRKGREGGREKKGSRSIDKGIERDFIHVI